MMNVEQFSSALGKVNDKYIMEAITYERKKKSGLLKWGAMAACLTLMLAIGIPVVIDQTRPMGGEDIIEIKQVQSDDSYLNAEQIFRPTVIQIDEPQLDKQFPATLPCYSVIAETVFTEDVIGQFAERAELAGILGSYSIETIHSGFTLINTNVAGSHSYD